MPSVVDICNLALSHLGDSATVASIDPPEGSAQAEHCARFYPIARDTLLEQHQWGFTTRRGALALLTATAGPEWDYAYTAPAGLLGMISVLPVDAPDDQADGNTYLPQQFALETLADGTQVILTDLPDAWARYTVSITDPTKFSPLFVECLAWLLASHLAGPLLKGEAGATAAKTCFNTYLLRLRDATQSDANDRTVRPAHVVPWMAVR